MAPRPQNDGENPKPKRKRRRVVDKDSSDYQEKRDRNNVAVKKSREQTRSKTKLTLDRVAHLRSENAQLEMQVKLLSKELDVLKDLFKVANPQDLASAPEAAKLLEAAIQTEKSEENAFIGDDLLEDGVKSENMDLLMTCENGDRTVEVNTRALYKDHEYVARN